MINSRFRHKTDIDITNGPLVSNIISFVIPIIITNILQMLYNAADMIVVGRYAGSISLAAAGASGPLINLTLNLFIGFSAGINSILARYIGARDEEKASQTVHTSYALALWCGLALTIFGVSICKPLLSLMGTPDSVIDYSVIYTRIIFLGTPANLLYNFGSAILRSMGDTKRPLYFLTLSGIINVVLNLIFIICFHMNVAGVALATIISQYISAALIMITLMRCENCCHLDLKKIRFHKEPLTNIIRLGLPAGVQSCTFSLSNVLIQSNINSFGATAMSGFSAGSNIFNFPLVIMDAFASAAIVFVAQNYGAGNYRRIISSTNICNAMVLAIGLVLGFVVTDFGPQLINIYTPGDPEVIEYGMKYLMVFRYFTFLGGINGVSTSALRGLGKSFVPMLVSIAGICGLRILWIYTIFAKIQTLDILYVSYPVSWIITSVTCTIMFYILAIRLKRKNS